MRDDDENNDDIVQVVQPPDVTTLPIAATELSAPPSPTAAVAAAAAGGGSSTRKNQDGRKKRNMKSERRTAVERPAATELLAPPTVAAGAGSSSTRKNQDVRGLGGKRRNKKLKRHTAIERNAVTLAPAVHHDDDNRRVGGGDGSAATTKHKTENSGDISDDEEGFDVDVPGAERVGGTTTATLNIEDEETAAPTTTTTTTTTSISRSRSTTTRGGLEEERLISAVLVVDGPSAATANNDQNAAILATAVAAPLAGYWTRKRIGVASLVLLLASGFAALMVAVVVGRSPSNNNNEKDNANGGGGVGVGVGGLRQQPTTPPTMMIPSVAPTTTKAIGAETATDADAIPTIPTFTPSSSPSCPEEAFSRVNGTYTIQWLQNYGGYPFYVGCEPKDLDVVATCTGNGANIALVRPPIRNDTTVCNIVSKNRMVCTTSSSMFQGEDGVSIITSGPIVTFSCTGWTDESVLAEAEVTSLTYKCYNTGSDPSLGVDFRVGSQEHQLLMWRACDKQINNEEQEQQLRRQGTCVVGEQEEPDVIDPIFAQCIAEDTCNGQVEYPFCTVTVPTVRVKATPVANWRRECSLCD